VTKKTMRKIIHTVSPFLLPIIGVLAILWFLIRVIPKPSRAAYPCQRVAAGLGGGFLTYLLAMLAPAAFLRHRNRQTIRYRMPIIVLSSIVLMAVMLPFLVPQVQSDIAAQGFTPVDPPNQPIGTARGIFPGRVVWVHDTSATNWDGVSGFWWSDANINQLVVNSMLSHSLQLISGKSTNAAAWDALFRFFNASRGLGDYGYQDGEKIVIKINCNQDSGQTWDNGGYQSPHLLYALVNQLITTVGVAGDNITIADPSRYIGDPIYNKIRSNPSAHFQAVHFVVKPSLSGNGRLAASPDFSHPIKFIKPDPTAADIPDHYPPTCYTEACYIINLSLIRTHTIFGVTLAAKNNFGSVSNSNGFSPSLLHGFTINKNEMGDPHCHPVLIGHEQLGGKTVLYLMDGLYTAITQGSKTITRWQTVNNDYFSSLLVSLDPVAIDSVALDFLRNEPTMQVPSLKVNSCNYLHEAALAGNPPSGSVYDPEGDGIALQNLGVHEHWNNATDRQYSRNLDIGNGIELIIGGPYTNIDFNSDCLTDIVWQNTTLGGNIVWYMNGVTRIGSVYLPTQNTVWAIVGCADFNADGKTDILFWNPATGRNIVWYMNGVARTGSVYLPTQDTAWTNAGPGDFNSDGKPDILWRNTSTGRNIVWYMDGVTRTGSVYLPTQDIAWTLAGRDDFNGDGKTDIVWWNAATGRNICWYMNGVARTGSVYLPTQDTAWENVGSGDFSGDGMPDMLWRNKTTGKNICWYMNGVARTGSVYLPTQPDLNWKLVN
jgi:hypothetical protein